MGTDCSARYDVELLANHCNILLINGASDKDVQDYQDSVEKLVCKDMDKEITADIN
jgi:hypothetical protein